ncbi:MAG: tetratricopeptide repeat protein [Deltaproteobacteria bacterium]|jgi:tetratricopeptide (TPR) repeat protein|nr:tetratricopeptide repeat protein [Deltaproteobacteria bacterium]
MAPYSSPDSSSSLIAALFRKLASGRKSAAFIAALSLALAFSALGCTSVAPRKHLAENILAGGFSGPAGEELAKALAAKSGRGGRKSLKLEGHTLLSYQTRQSRENVAPDEGAYTAAQPFQSDTMSSTLTARWTLTDMSTGRIVKSGETADTLRRAAGGWLASQGAAAEALPSEIEARGVLALALADQIIEELGPAWDSSAIEGADDERSRKARQLAMAGRWDEAADLWKELTALNPDYASAHYNLGLYYERNGRLEEAWASYRRAFLSQGHPHHREALTRLTDSLDRLGRRPRPSGSSLGLE